MLIAVIMITIVLINNNYNNKQNTKEQIEEMLSVAATQSIQDVADL